MKWHTHKDTSKAPNSTRTDQGRGFSTAPHKLTRPFDPPHSQQHHLTCVEMSWA